MEVENPKMYDNFIWSLSLGTVFLIGNAELGTPSILEGVGSTAIVGFVVWFMMTKMNESLKELTKETKKAVSELEELYLTVSISHGIGEVGELEERLKNLRIQKQRKETE